LNGAGHFIDILSTRTRSPNELQLDIILIYCDGIGNFYHNLQQFGKMIYHDQPSMYYISNGQANIETWMCGQTIGFLKFDILRAD
jgi:hypothetical protein